MKASPHPWKHFLFSSLGLVTALALVSIVAIDIAHHDGMPAQSFAAHVRDHAKGILLALAALVGVAFFVHRLTARVSQLGTFYGNLLQTTEAIVWEADARDFHFAFVSDRAERLLGYPVGAWRERGFWLDHLHPQDQLWVPEYCAVQNANLEPYQFEFRIQAHDGRYLWLQNLVTVVAKNGQPTRMHGLMIDISERKNNEKHFRRLLSEKDAILQNAIVGIAFVRKRHIVSCNRRCEELFHYNPGELNDMPTEALFATRELYQSIGAAAYASAARGETYNAEVQFKYKEGKPFWGAITGRVLDAEHPQDASVWIFADISNRRAAIEESRRLRRAVEQSPVSILITNNEGVIEYVNPKFSDVTGYTREEALGQNPRILRSGEMSAETYRSLWSTILAGNVWRGELHNRRRSGELFWEDATIAPVLDEHGAITHFIAIKEDITDRKQFQDQLARHQMHLEELVVERTHALAKALSDARAADRTKDAFLANVSHEMRTPLNAVIGLSALALENASDARQRDYLEKISGAGETLLGIINDLLDLTKIAAGRMELDPGPFSLRQLLERLVAIMTHRAHEKGLELRLDITADMPARLIGDALRLNQILMNLLGNAIKFTTRGHVALSVLVTASDADAVLVRFAVADTGIGINPTAQLKLFNPFTQADASITRRFGGTGLGLAICKQLVELMAGTLEIDSTQDQGSTFSFSLRLPLAPLEMPTAAQTEIDFAAPPRFIDSRILLVEDQALNRQIVEELLAKLDITVDVAENGRIAVEKLEAAADGHYDLVLMDVQMPEMDGLTATRHLRAQPRFAALPIVAMTAHTLTHERAETLASGMNDHLGKPFNPRDIYDLLWRWLPTHKRVAPTPDARQAPPPSPANDFPALPGFDFSAALRRCAGNSDSYRRWLAAFLDEDRSSVDAIDRLIEEGEMETARKRLHALKGRTGMLGLASLHDAVSALEAEMKHGLAPEPLRAEFRATNLSTRATLEEVLGITPPT